jgi:hypothetical protein
VAPLSKQDQDDQVADALNGYPSSTDATGTRNWALKMLASIGYDRKWLEIVIHPDSECIAPTSGWHGIDHSGNRISRRGRAERQLDKIKEEIARELVDEGKWGISESAMKDLEAMIAAQAIKLDKITEELTEEIRHGQVPRVGMMVVYTNLGSVNDRGEMIYPPTQQAMLITAVDAEGVHGNVYYKGGGVFPMTAVPYSDHLERGTWSWPGI